MGNRLELGSGKIDKFILLLMIIAATSLAACRKPKKSSTTSSPYEIPEYLKTPPLFSPVPIGSKDLVATPPPGEMAGTLLLKLASEPGAKIYYSYNDPGETPDLAGMTELQENLHILPPVTIWAVAQVAGATGPVRKFDYTYNKALFDPASNFLMTRTPSRAFKQIPLANSVEFIRYDPDADKSRQQLKDKPDGTIGAWPGSGRYLLTDGLYDVPDFLGAIDISWTQVNVSTQKIELILVLRDKPVSRKGTVYGFDIGDSGVGLASFGKGVAFHYRVEFTNGILGLVDKGTSASLSVSSDSAAMVADVVEFSVLLSDLPLLSGLKNIVIRPFTYDLNEGVQVSDRLEPFLVRTEFAVDRAVVANSDKRVWEINFLMESAIKPESLSGKYLSLSGPLIDDLEKMNQIPFYSRGSLQLFFVDKEENGYAGLNTSDRGMLTTLGQQTSLIAKAQLLAHEFAHYQNARNSSINERWIQEGMSEWSAERYLYRHFPKRAVYKFMRRLRYDHYFDVTGDKLDSFPLAEWGTDASTIGYEKSLMFTNIIEREIGHENLVRLYQIGVNAPLKTAEFKEFAEKLSGKDLTGLFNFWAYAGPLDPKLSPLTLFKDDDGDGLMTFDESSFGTASNKPDTDSDGYPDGEEYFRNMDPLVSLIDPEGTLDGENIAVLVNILDKDTMALTRIGGEKNASFTYSFVPGDGEPGDNYAQPLFFRPPYTLSVQSLKAGVPGTARTLQRDLYVAGAKVILNYASDQILPPSPLTIKNLISTFDQFDSVGSPSDNEVLQDNPSELPDFLGSLDITGFRSSETATELVFTISTRLPPDPYGQYGDIVLSFDEVNWQPTGPDAHRVNALTLNAGSPFWHTVKNSTESAQLINTGVEVDYGKNLKIVVQKSLLTDWMAGTGERLVCINTNIEIERDSKFKDRAGCLTFSHPGFSSSIARTADQFGLTDHQVQVFWDSGSTSSVRVNNALAVGLSAIRSFEKVLQRPLFDRNHWPIHLSIINGSSTYGSATQKAGAWLTAAPSLEGNSFDYLVVEQLARLVTTDLLERSNFVPFWMQEFLIQWLTSSAMYNLYPTKDVHSFHAGRIGDFNCYVDGTPSCSSYFSGDLPLVDWNSATLASTGSVKSLMLALYIDAQLGSDTIAKGLGPWFSAVPAGPVLEATLTGYLPAAATLIESMMTTWVEGSTDAAADTAAIRALFVDGDADGLFLFEEQKLGFIDSVPDNYLD